MVKKVIQQGHSRFDARSVLSVREHGKMARTPLVAFFNIPTINVAGHETNHSTQSLAVETVHRDQEAAK